MDVLLYHVGEVMSEIFGAVNVYHILSKVCDNVRWSVARRL